MIVHLWGRGAWRWDARGRKGKAIRNLGGSRIPDLQLFVLKMEEESPLHSTGLCKQSHHFESLSALDWLWPTGQKEVAACLRVLSQWGRQQDDKEEAWCCWRRRKPEGAMTWLRRPVFPRSLTLCVLTSSPAPDSESCTPGWWQAGEDLPLCFTSAFIHICSFSLSPMKSFWKRCLMWKVEYSSRQLKSPNNCVNLWVWSADIGDTCMLRHFSSILLFVTPWTVAHQAPLPQGFSRQEYWSGLPCLPPRDLPNPGIEPASLCLLLWQVSS